MSGGVGDEAETIEFIGVQDVTLNPAPYNEMAIWNLSMATRIPQDILKGVSAGRITGSEVNERAYFKFIKSEQSNVEPIVRELIDRLIDTGQVTHRDERRTSPTKDYRIEWNYPQLIHERDQATIEYLKERAQAERLRYRTIDEVRAKSEDELGPLPDGQGEVLAATIETPRGGYSPFASNPERRERERTEEDNVLNGDEERDNVEEFNDTVLKDALERGRNE